MEMQRKDSFSWMFKVLLQIRDQVKNSAQWNHMKQSQQFKMKKMYTSLMEQSEDMDWKGLIMGNQARPRAKIILWLACHGRLATKDRLVKFGMISDTKCEFCLESETLQHMFFECSATRSIWKEVMRWLHIENQEGGWMQVKNWSIKLCKSKNWRKEFYKIALAECIYAIWLKRNRRV
ncbi:uncharacterized protein LOC131597466 [Vicia villosa]|uniref:uncharacterized protein LOC131597466 n=1 Tax=Vicia villosa TaxID=3911 RepID=UPI00273B8BF9|nr:uncharacterized protein LOC131597466 [Vicia villosa]